MNFLIAKRAHDGGYVILTHEYYQGSGWGPVYLVPKERFKANFDRFDPPRRGKYILGKCKY